MINDEAKNCYYFSVKNLSKLHSMRWLRSKKVMAITTFKMLQMMH